MEILQLWLNLPARLKMTAPRYTGLQRSDIPVLSPGPGVSLKLIAGRLGGLEGPLASLTDTFMATIDLEEGAEIKLSAPAERTVFLYIVRGEAMIAGAPAAKWNLAQLGDGDEVHIASEREALVIFGHSAPLKEPVVAHGPFVMNTRDEIAQAIRDYQSGQFGDPADLA
jgi:redox-sensitive bicupin YhaK (pirin superfamily)